MNLEEGLLFLYCTLNISSPDPPVTEGARGGREESNPRRGLG